jgi:hypothetical protein
MVQARNGTAVAGADGSKALSLLLAMIGVIALVTWAATIKMRTNDNQDENEPVGAGRREGVARPTTAQNVSSAVDSHELWYRGILKLQRMGAEAPFKSVAGAGPLHSRRQR